MADNHRSLVRVSGTALLLYLKGLLPYGSVASTSPGAPQGVARPLLGGARTGWHYQPVPSIDEVIAIGETEASWHTGSVSVANPLQMESKNNGESWQYTPSGQIANYAQANGTYTVVQVNGALIAIDTLGNITCSPASGGALTVIGTVSLTGTLNVTGGININGIPVVVPDVDV